MASTIEARVKVLEDQVLCLGKAVEGLAQQVLALQPVKPGDAVPAAAAAVGDGVAG